MCVCSRVNITYFKQRQNVMEPLLPLSGVQWVLRGQSPGEQMPLIHFPGGATVKNLPAVQETRVRSLAQEDPVEKEMAAHSSILAWRTPWTEEPGGLQSMGSQRVGRDWARTSLNLLSLAFMLCFLFTLLLVLFLSPTLYFKFCWAFHFPLCTPLPRFSNSLVGMIWIVSLLF